MNVDRTPATLRSRLDVQFYRRPRRFIKRVWLVSLVCGLVPLAWIALAMGRGQFSHFAAGNVSTAHRLIENDCAKCHETWAPAMRLVSFGSDIHSTTSVKCLGCHEGAPHHTGDAKNVAGKPPSTQVECATCHREHHGNAALDEVADAFCVECHANLSKHGGKNLVANRIEAFDRAIESGGHPEFAVQTKLKLTQPGAQAQKEDVVEWFLREDDKRLRDRVEKDKNLQWVVNPVEHYQDRGRIRFNHAVHLFARYENDKLVAGLRDNQGKLHDFSQKCDVCHRVDPAGRYMLPIRYEQHCSTCHADQLQFDRAGFAGQRVPHEKPTIVRGFLADVYTQAAMKELPTPSADATGDAKSERLFPDLPYTPRLPTEVNKRIQNRIQVAENTLFGHEAAGGCRYCHEVVDPPKGGLWTVVNPRIPERWMRSSLFRHDRHTMLNCRACHENVDASASTGDVLLPAIDLCRKCHTNQAPAAESGGTFQPKLNGARTRCVECHAYHQLPADKPDRTSRSTDPWHDIPRWHGTLDKNLHESRP